MAKSSFTRSLIYVFPGMMDMVGGIIAFTALVRASKLGASTFEVAGVGACESGVYLLVSLLVGRLVSSRTAGFFIIAACTGSVILATLFSQVNHVIYFFPLMMMSGTNMACFFVSFQVFMKAVDTGANKPIPFSAGMYTMSWSIGFALGPFVSGFLMELQNTAGEDVSRCVPNYIVAACLAIATGIGVFLLKHHAEAHGAETHQEAIPAPAAESPYSKMPDISWVSWVACGTGIMVFWLIMRIFPKEATSLDWPDRTKGLVLFTMLITQAATAFALKHTKSWMYDWRRIVLFGMCGIAGLATMAVGDTPAAYFAGAVMFGVYTGALFFYYVFHAIVHPEKCARCVSVNESIVGSVGVAGPLWAGFLADHFTFEVPYFVGCAFIAAALIFQSLMHHKYVKQLPEITRT